jgi:NitT/TauT family transport system permease protein
MTLFTRTHRLPEATSSTSELPQRARRQPPSQIITLSISSVLLLVTWQAIVLLTNYPVWLLPGPRDVLVRLGQALSDGTLQQHALPTLIESVGGFVLALLIGSMLGYTVAHSRMIERWLAPYLAAVQAIPVIAVAPLIIIWFGYSSDLARNIVVAAIVVFFPIFSSTVTAIRDIPRELREVGQVEGATPWQRLRYIEVPLALPVLFTGFRTSLAYATTGAVVGEFIGSRYGLGALINVARGFFDTPLIFVALIALGAITLLFYSLLVGLERLLLPWREQL